MTEVFVEQPLALHGSAIHEDDNSTNDANE